MNDDQIRDQLATIGAALIVGGLIIAIGLAILGGLIRLGEWVIP